MNMKIKSLMLSLFLLMSAGAILSACGTVHGAGEDLEHGSNAVEKTL
jgi:predicted small secreted protein